MRRGSILLACAVLAGLLAGCLGKQTTKSGNWLDRLRPFQGPTGADVVMMDVAILECPIGDHYINDELWTRADEQIVDLERKALLEENGFRIAQIGGMTPPELHKRLTSERTNTRPRRLLLHAGHPTAVTLGGPVPECTFTVNKEGDARTLAISNGQFQFEVTPTLTKNERTTLQFTPKIEHGTSAVIPRPAADRSGWEMREHRPTESFPTLAWEVALAPNEYIIIGGRFDRPGTVGHEFFLRTDGTPVQRLLVIRTGRSSEGVGVEVASTQEASPRRSAPLAIQAAYTAVRGQSPR